MPLEILTGSDMPSLLQRAQGALGPDAVVVSVRRVVHAGRLGFEMVAADPVTARAVERAERQAQSPPPAAVDLWTNPLADPGRERRAASPPPAARPSSSTAAPARPSPPRPAAPPHMPPAAADAADVLWADPSLVRPAPRRRWPWTRSEAKPPRRPLVVALVGPTGAGKTTTLAKLATSTLAFAGRRVGLLGLDTYRVGGAEQLRQYAELARLPFELAHDARDLERARRRLADVEVILVDTAGRGPAAEADLAAMQQQLLELAPDEVHLVLPAGLQSAVARAVATRHLRLGATHVLPTKLDEHRDERVAFEIAAAFALPMRWITDGQEVPADLALAPAGAPGAAGVQRAFAPSPAAGVQRPFTPSPAAGAQRTRRMTEAA